MNNKQIAFYTGLSIVVLSHVFILIGFKNAFLSANHSYINLFAALLIYWGRCRCSS